MSSLDLSSILPPPPGSRSRILEPGQIQDQSLITDLSGAAPDQLEILQKASKIWEPQPKQLEFLSIPFEVDEALYGGAAFGGKSEILLAIPIYYQFYLHPEFIGIIFRRTYPELFKSLLPRTERFYKAFGGEWNGEEKCWNFKSGAKLFLSYLDSMKAARAHDTNQYNYVGFEEVTHFEWDVYSYIVHSRMRSTTKALPAICRAASNPGNIGHAWVKKYFVDPAPSGGKIIREDHGDGKVSYRIFIKALVQDNPKGLEADPNYINRLMRLPEAERRAKLYGDWDAYVGEVFAEWRESRYPDEPANACHVIEPFEIPFWWPKLAAIDWGWDAMTWIGWGAISPDGRLYMYRERMYKRTFISRWAADFASETSQDGNFVGVWLDPSAWDRRGDPESIQEQFARISGYIPNKADRGRVSGKMLLHDFLRWKPRPSRHVPQEGFKPEKFEAIRRFQGEDAALEYAKLFLPEEPEKNLPLLQIFNACKGVITVIPQCVPDEKNPEDVAEFPGDDPYDGIRYLCKAARRYLESGKDEAESRSELAHILETLERTRDYTQFHRMMEIHESRSRTPVRMWNRRRRSIA